MKSLPTAVVSLAACVAVARIAPAPATLPVAASVGYMLDTSLEALVADPGTKAVLDADLPSVTTHSMFDSSKAIALSLLAPMTPGRMSPTALARVSADPAAIR